jgi:hypothetical protein
MARRDRRGSIRCTRCRCSGTSRLRRPAPAHTGRPLRTGIRRSRRRRLERRRTCRSSRSSRIGPRSAPRGIRGRRSSRRIGPHNHCRPVPHRTRHRPCNPGNSGPCHRRCPRCPIDRRHPHNTPPSRSRGCRRIRRPRRPDPEGMDRRRPRTRRYPRRRRHPHGPDRRPRTRLHPFRRWRTTALRRAPRGSSRPGTTSRRRRRALPGIADHPRRRCRSLHRRRSRSRRSTDRRSLRSRGSPRQRLRSSRGSDRRGRCRSIRCSSHRRSVRSRCTPHARCRPPRQGRPHRPRHRRRRHWSP